jgi:hypothetical protein
MGIWRHASGAPLLLASPLWFASLPAEALTPVAQDRHVFASQDWIPDRPSDYAEMLSAPDYAPFSASVDGIVGPPSPFPYFDLAVQQSSIEPDRLLVSGRSKANPDSEPGVGHEIISESVYAVDFTLDTPQSFTLTGQLDLFAEIGGYETSTSSISLTGPGGVIAEVHGRLPQFPVCPNGCVASLPLSTAGVLEPGSYRLEARCDTEARGVIGPHGEYNSFAEASYAADLALEPLAPQVPALPLMWIPPLLVALAGSARRKLIVRSS